MEKKNKPGFRDGKHWTQTFSGHLKLKRMARKRFASKVVASSTTETGKKSNPDLLATIIFNQLTSDQKMTALEAVNFGHPIN